MPNRYEREIEEILRNLESTEAKPGRPGLGQKFGERVRRKPVARSRPRRRGFPSLKFGYSEWLIFIAVVSALIAGGYAYANNGNATIVTGLLAVVGIICLILVVVTPFIARSRQPSRSFGFSNVTPIQRNPLSSLVTRWNLFLLKLRYRRKNNRNSR